MLDVNSINSFFANPWLLLLAILSLPGVFQICAHLIFLKVDTRSHKASAAVEDHAGAWLTTQTVLFPSVRTLKVHPQTALIQAVDGYWPSIHTVVLENKTFWGRRNRDRQIAAHELGHALLHSRHPFWGRCLHTARAFRGPVHLLVLAYVAVSLLFVTPSPLLYAASFTLAFSSHFLVLVDEGLASVFAYRHLNANTDTSSNGVHLFAAWLVYFFPVVGLFLQFLTLQDSVHLAAATIDTPVGDLQYQPVPLLVVLSLILIKRSSTVLKIMFKADAPHTLAQHEVFLQRAITGDLFGGVGALLFCGLTFWSNPNSVPMYAYWLAMIPGALPLQLLGQGLVQWFSSMALRPFTTSSPASTEPSTPSDTPLETIRLLSANAAHRKKTLWLHILFLPLIAIWWFKYLPSPGL